MDERRSVSGREGPPDGESASRKERIRLVVAAIPEGVVSTYGDIAAYAGLPRRARLVGRILAELPTGSRLPWHRVVRADGSIASRGGGEDVQARRLQAEGVMVRAGRVDLLRHRWQP